MKSIVTLLLLGLVASFASPSEAEASQGRYYRRVYGRVVVRPTLVIGPSGISVVPVVTRRFVPSYRAVRYYRRHY